MDKRAGYHSTSGISSTTRSDIIRYINMKLASMGQPSSRAARRFRRRGGKRADRAGVHQSRRKLLNNYRKKTRLLRTGSSIRGQEDSRLF
jgi:hypothetical protein